MVMLLLLRRMRDREMQVLQTQTTLRYGYGTDILQVQVLYKYIALLYGTRLAWPCTVVPVVQ